MKTYNFLFSGTPEQFEAAVERYRADAFERGDGSYLFDNLKRIELAAVWRAAFSHRLCAHF